MLQVSLLEPAAAGRISGGFLYNQKLAAHTQAIARRSAEHAHLASAVAGMELGPDNVLLADSLFLDRVALTALFDLKSRVGCRVGCLVHAMPSFIQRAHLPVREMDTAAWQPSAEELELLAQLDVVVAPGPYIPALLAAAGVTTPCVVCLPGCEQRAPEARNAPRVPARILTVATLAPNKGHLDAIAALSGIKDLDWHWDVVGGTQVLPAFSTDLRQAIDRHGLTSRVAFRGELPSEAIWDEVNAADLLLHASYTENQPLIVMEALAAALPVVGYRVGGMCDLIAVTGAGRLAPLLDTGALTSALKDLLTERSAYAPASHAALRTAQSWTTWSKRAAKLLADLGALFGGN